MFAKKGYTSNQKKEVFVIKKVINTVLWTYLIADLNGEETFRTYYEEKLQKINQTEFRVEQVFKRGDKLYVKWKGYDNSFDSSIDKKDVII